MPEARDRAARRVDADVAAVEERNPEDVADLVRPRADDLGEGRDADAHQLALRALLRLLAAKPLVVDRLQHLLQCRVIVSAIERPAERRRIRKLLGLDEVAPPDLRLVETELLREHVDHPLDQVDRLGHAQRAPVRDPARCLVGVDGVDTAIGLRNVVRTGADAEEAGRELGRRHVRIERAVVGERGEAQRLDAAVLVGCKLADAVIVAREAGRADVLHPRLDPLDRNAGDDRRDDRDDVPRIDGNLVAEPAADVATDDADLALRNPREHRDDRAHQVRRLRGHVDGKLAADLVERRDAAAGLERARVHARIEDRLAHGDRRAREHCVGAGLVAGLPGEDVVGMRARPVTDLGLVGDVLADHRRVGRHRFVRIDDRRELLVIDLDGLRSVGSRVAIGCEHHRDFLELEADLLVGEHGLHVAAERGHPVKVHRLQIVGSEHRDDAGDREGLRLVDRLDPRVRIGAAHDRAEQHPGELDVVDVAALAADEARVLLALARELPSPAGSLSRSRVSAESGIWNPPVADRSGGSSPPSWLRRTGQP